jgi:hypothetical protein
MTCVCGRPIVRGTVLPWTHLVNPGRDHHYARPLPPSADQRRLAAMQQTNDAR